MRLTLAAAAFALAAVPALAPALAQNAPAPYDDASLRDVLAAVKAAQADANARAAEQKATLDAILAQLKAASGNTAVAGSTAVASSAPATPGPANPFPAQPGDAPFPSPENSRIVRIGSSVQGRPYLLDGTGAIHTLGPIGRNGTGYYINGNEVTDWNSTPVNQLLVRQAKVYGQIQAGNWQLANPDMGNNMYNASLPEMVAANTGTPGGTGTGTAAAPPAPVTPSAIAPGSNGHVLTVGRNCSDLYACIKASKDGDTVDGAGALLPHSAPRITTAIKIRNFRMDCSSGEITMGKGCIVGDKDLVVEDAEIYGSARNKSADSGVGCVRPNSTSVVVLTRVDIHDCVQGVAGGGFPWSLTVTDSHLHGNGLGDGLTHNLYVSQQTVSVTLVRVVSDKPRGGHAIKSRAASFSADGCTFSADETLIDLPNGTATVATVNNTTLTKTSGSGNHRLIGYGEEGATNGTAGVAITGGTVTGGDSPFIQGQGGKVTFSGTTIIGTRPAGQGVTVTGS